MAMTTMREAVLKALVDLRSKTGPNDRLDQAIKEIEVRANE
jgi:hypothetical protein